MKTMEGNKMLYDEIPQLQSEIDKMDEENRLTEVQSKAYIDGFVNDIKKIDRKELINAIPKPKKIKIPFKYRIKRFFDRLNNTLG